MADEGWEDDRGSLIRMVQGFRLSELQQLMGFVGKSKAGRLEDLQRAALDLLGTDSLPVKMKIRELHSLRGLSQDIVRPVRSDMPPMGQLPPVRIVVPRPSYGSPAASNAFHPAFPPPAAPYNTHSRYMAPLPTYGNFPWPANAAPAYNYGNFPPYNLWNIPPSSYGCVPQLSGYAAPPPSFENFPRPFNAAPQPVCSNFLPSSYETMPPSTLGNAPLNATPSFTYQNVLRTLNAASPSSVGSIPLPPNGAPPSTCETIPSTTLGNIPRLFDAAPPSTNENILPSTCGNITLSSRSTALPSSCENIPLSTSDNIRLSSKSAVSPSSYENNPHLRFHNVSVKFKQSPFFQVVTELHKPVVTIPPAMSLQSYVVRYTFELTAQQATEIKNSSSWEGNPFQTLIHLRCCLADTRCEQVDNFPNNIWLKVNGNPCLLPKPVVVSGGGARRPSQPIDITLLVDTNLFPVDSPLPVLNHLLITWDTKDMAKYAVAVYLVRKLTAEHLLDRVIAKGIVHQDFTKNMIKEKLKESAESGITTMHLRVSLLCPLSKRRMEFPCRATDCRHLQCFDALSYIQMNALNPTWNCPVCIRPTPYESLYRDGLFTYILEAAEEDRKEILFLEDGVWELEKVVEPAVRGGSDVIVDFETNPGSEGAIKIEQNSNDD